MKSSSWMLAEDDNEALSSQHSAVVGWRLDLGPLGRRLAVGRTQKDPWWAETVAMSQLDLLARCGQEHFLLIWICQELSPDR